MIERAVSRSSRSGGEHPPGDHPGEQRGEDQHPDVHPHRDLQRLVHLVQLVGEVDRHREHAARPAAACRTRARRRSGTGSRRPARARRAAARRWWRARRSARGDAPRQARGRALVVELAVDVGVEGLALGRARCATRKTSKIARTSLPNGLRRSRGSRPIVGQPAELLDLLHERVVDALARAREQHLAQDDRADRRREEQEDQVGGEDARARAGEEAAALAARRQRGGISRRRRRRRPPSSSSSSSSSSAASPAAASPAPAAGGGRRRGCAAPGPREPGCGCGRGAGVGRRCGAARPRARRPARPARRRCCRAAARGPAARRSRRRRSRPLPARGARRGRGGRSAPSLGAVALSGCCSSIGCGRRRRVGAEQRSSSTPTATAPRTKPTANRAARRGRRERRFAPPGGCKSVLMIVGSMRGPRVANRSTRGR